MTRVILYYIILYVTLLASDNFIKFEQFSFVSVMFAEFSFRNDQILTQVLQLRLLVVVNFYK